MCPECKNNIAYIENVNYESKMNDFMITYSCKYQTPDDKHKTSYLINIIHIIDPITSININNNFISEENLNKILEKKDEFVGDKVIIKIYDRYNNKLEKKNSLNRSDAPSAEWDKPLGNQSKLTNSDFHLSVFKSLNEKQTTNKKSINYA